MNKKFFYGIAVIALALCATESNAQDKVFVDSAPISTFGLGDEHHKFVIRDTTAKSMDAFFHIEKY
jgi:hypothetical protein